ncbi:MAG: c-type cytochrome [Pseudomonadales bacterium]|nr:c-type cytochrome [Pseudomonadales bacterium]
MGAISHNAMQRLLAVLVVFGVAFAGPAMASKLKDQSGSDEPIGTRSILSPAKVAERTAPDAKVCLEGEECGEASAAVAAEAVAATPEDLYNSKCSSCHVAGVLGAPVPGKADQWAARIANGTDALYQNAIGGINAMPPKGGCADCSDDDIKAIVDFMVGQSQ